MVFYFQELHEKYKVVSGLKDVQQIYSDLFNMYYTPHSKTLQQTDLSNLIKICMSVGKWNPNIS